MSNDSSTETSSLIEESWIPWFCNLNGNQFFCEIDKSYVDDAFNLFGLKQYFPKDYNRAVDVILDRLGASEAENDELSRCAALLYGLIHARFIVTSNGLEMMMGFTDEPKHGIVKLFCPRCQDVYSCGSSHRHIDGSFFGPTFPSLFLMTFEELVPDPPADRYVPRIFGFRVHSSSKCLPRNKGWREPFQTLPLYHRGSPVTSTCLGNNSSFATLNNPEGVTDAVGDGSCAASLLPVGEKRAGALQASILSLSLVAEDNDHTLQKSAEDVDVDLLKGGGSGLGRGRGLGPRTLTYGTSAPAVTRELDVGGGSDSSLYSLLEEELADVIRITATRPGDASPTWTRTRDQESTPMPNAAVDVFRKEISCPSRGDVSSQMGRKRKDQELNTCGASDMPRCMKRPKDSFTSPLFSNVE